jgi:hypothetical protein
VSQLDARYRPPHSNAALGHDAAVEISDEGHLNSDTLGRPFPELPPRVGSSSKGLEAPMSNPQLGDLVIRGTTNDGFEVVEAITSKRIAGPFQTLAVALASARTSVDGGAIWQQSVDHRGRPLGDPLLLPRLPGGDSST